MRPSRNSSCRRMSLVAAVRPLLPRPNWRERPSPAPSAAGQLRYLLPRWDRHCLTRHSRLPAPYLSCELSRGLGPVGEHCRRWSGRLAGAGNGGAKILSRGSGAQAGLPAGEVIEPSNVAGSPPVPPSATPAGAAPIPPPPPGATQSRSTVSRIPQSTGPSSEQPPPELNLQSRYVIGPGMYEVTIANSEPLGEVEQERESGPTFIGGARLPSTVTAAELQAFRDELRGGKVWIDWRPDGELGLSHQNKFRGIRVFARHRVAAGQRRQFAGH